MRENLWIFWWLAIAIRWGLHFFFIRWKLHEFIALVGIPSLSLGFPFVIFSKIYNIFNKCIFLLKIPPDLVFREISIFKQTVLQIYFTNNFTKAFADYFLIGNSWLLESLFQSLDDFINNSYFYLLKLFLVMFLDQFVEVP